MPGAEVFKRHIDHPERQLYLTEKTPILPIPSIADSVNQMFPSGPVVIPTGCARHVGTA
jgi:hypothetical protein